MGKRTSCPLLSTRDDQLLHARQENFWGNDRNKDLSIKMIVNKCNLPPEAEIEALQESEDADSMIVKTAVSKSSSYPRTFIVGEDLLILLCHYSTPIQNIYVKSI